MKKRDYTPLVLWLILFTGIVVSSFARPSPPWDIGGACPFHPDMLLVVSYLLWMLVELRTSVKDVAKEGKQTSDSAICLLYATGQAFTILTALWFPPLWSGPNGARLAGVVIFFFGIAYRLWAVKTLGRFYSHRVQTIEKHRIVDFGPYRYTKHPAYAGMLLIHFGITIYFFNPWTTCVFLLVLTPAIFCRIAIEERTLSRVEGYSAFARTRKRLIPKVW